MTGSDIDHCRASEATSIHAIFTVGLVALRDRVTRDLGALTPRAMTEVGRGLAAALGL